MARTLTGTTPIETLSISYIGNCAHMAFYPVCLVLVSRELNQGSSAANQVQS